MKKMKIFQQLTKLPSAMQCHTFWTTLYRIALLLMTLSDLGGHFRLSVIGNLLNLISCTSEYVIAGSMLLPTNRNSYMAITVTMVTKVKESPRSQAVTYAKQVIISRCKTETWFTYHRPLKPGFHYPS